MRLGHRPAPPAEKIVTVPNAFFLRRSPWLSTNLLFAVHYLIRTKKDRDENIVIQSGGMKPEKVRRTNRDFRTTWAVWSEVISNYAVMSESW